MEPIEELIQLWRRRGVRLNPGATPEDIENLSQLVGVDLPHDVRSFYSKVNGMPDDTYDDHEVSFWSIAKMQSELARSGDAEVGFADFLIDSWRFIFRKSSHGLVVVSENVVPGSPFEEIGTFSDFVATYIRRPAGLGIL